MLIKSIKTHKITQDDNLYNILEKYLPRLEEKSIVVITSKILSILDGLTLKTDGINRDELIISEADYYLPRDESKYGKMLTIKDNLLMLHAGIDFYKKDEDHESYAILWPRQIQTKCDEILQYLKKFYSISFVGVIITDSRALPLRKGVTGVGLAYCGFEALNKNDMLGNKLFLESNILDGLSSAAVLEMGEGKELTPLAIIQDVPFVNFTSTPDQEKGIQSLWINREDDVFAPLLNSPSWIKSPSKS